MFSTSRPIKVKRGESYVVIPVQAGKYMWSNFGFNHMKTDLKASNSFEVKQNAITYLGDITIRVNGQLVTLNNRDRSQEMRAYLAAEYPVHSKSMEFALGVVHFAK